MKEEDAILLAEDSEDDLVLMRHAFRRAGIRNRVHEVRHGKDAINYLQGLGPYADRERYPLPCVIITDIKMPYNGITFLEWLRSKPEFHHVPKLVLSSSGMDVDRDRAAELGACAYFVKPNDVQALVDVVITIDEDWISNHCPMPKKS
jgi:CheY-like chemotaxis protein